MKQLMAGLALGLMASGANAAFRTQEVDYSAGGIPLKGYLAWDDSLPDRRPGVLVVHEWWGHNAYVRKRAEQLAGMGYTALALDMYGEGRHSEHPEQAKAFMQQAMQDREGSVARFVAAQHLLQAQPSVDPSRIAAIGYCFGGGVVLDMARRGLDLKAVASFHGMLGTATPAQSGQVKARVLVANGQEDGFVSPEQIAGFKQEMEHAGVDYTFVNYAGARHSFTNPEADAIGARHHMPVSYNAAADKASWAELARMLDEVFRP